MTEHLLVGLASIITLGILAQWLAWRLKLPSILFLLIFGFLAGTVTNLINPDEIFGRLLMPIVAISVAMILFEGGLTLKISELHEIGRVVRNLITLGVALTWLSVAALAHFLLDLNLTPSLLIGAILVVTGPTVIGPLLRHIRPVGRVGKIVKWEGILNDPVGAILAVLVFEAVLAGEMQHAAASVIFSVVKTLFFGGIVAGIGALLLTSLLGRYWIPDYLQEAVTFAMVVIVFAVSNSFQEESGLLAVTVMGIVLANQKKVNIQHIVRFKENLRVLIISSLFILLAARLQLSDLSYLNMSSLFFLGALVLLVRPAAVALSSFRTDLKWKESLFISWMAPRGIVAAAITAIFAERLSELGIPQTEHLVPLVFIVIIGTVGLYGLTAPLLAQVLKISESSPQGVVILGAHPFARAVGKVLQDEGFKVLLIDTNHNNEYAARMQGLNTHLGNGVSEDIFDELDLGGFKLLLALTANDEANSLAALHFSNVFGRSEVYQLAPEKEQDKLVMMPTPRHLRGRFLFGYDIHSDHLQSRLESGAKVKKVSLTNEFDYEAFMKRYGDAAIPLFVITENKRLSVCTAKQPVSPSPGESIVALVNT